MLFRSGVDVPDNAGFDIDAFSGTAYAALGDTLYTVDLASGAAAEAGRISDGTITARDIAVRTPSAALMVGVTGTGPSAALIQFPLDDPSSASFYVGNAPSTRDVADIVTEIVVDSDRKATTPPVPLAAGETIVGLSYRPRPLVANTTLPFGQLFALSKNGAALCVYTINTRLTDIDTTAAFN